MEAEEGRRDDDPCEARLRRLVAAVRRARHDANNTLSIARGYAELLAVDTSLPPEAREAAHEILQGVDGTLAALDSLLAEVAVG
jgi:hypothetical protein